MRSAVALIVAAALLPIALAQPCGGACKPWHLGKNSPAQPCTIGKFLNTRMLADVNPAYVNVTVPNAFNDVPYATYGFCHKVDELQSLHITGFVPQTMLSDTDAFGPNSTAYLRMYGLGSFYNRTFPLQSDSASAVLARTDYDLCQPGEIAVANFLVLNITLNNGLLQYRDNGSPMFTGFQSSCQNGVCMFGPAGSAYPCIGDENSQNCAKCISNSSTSLANLTVSVWVSYYGTDADGTPMTSGQENPLNFREFALNSAYDSLANDVSIP